MPIFRKYLVISISAIPCQSVEVWNVGKKWGKIPQKSVDISPRSILLHVDSSLFEDALEERIEGGAVIIGGTDRCITDRLEPTVDGIV